MTKESIIELQKIDCNCNDCKHLLRNTWPPDHYNRVFHEHEERVWMNHNERQTELATAYANRDRKELARIFKKKYVYSKIKTCFGWCKKLDHKPLIFLPNTCQTDTQECFEHRKG